MEEQKLYTSIGEQLSGAEKSQMFGKPCFKTNGKAFICFFQNEMVFKLPKEIHEQTISLEGSQLFDPSGKKRPMKEWVQVPYNYKEKWPELAKKAMEYVNESLK